MSTRKGDTIYLQPGHEQADKEVCCFLASHQIGSGTVNSYDNLTIHNSHLRCAPNMLIAMGRTALSSVYCQYNSDLLYVCYQLEQAAGSKDEQILFLSFYCARAHR